MCFGDPGMIEDQTTSYNYPMQLIRLTNLPSDTTYNYCAVIVNTTDMMEIGDPVAGILLQWMMLVVQLKV